MPITKKLDNKVVASARVALPAGDLGSFPPLNPGGTPSTNNGNSPPTVPASHGLGGSRGGARNPSGADR